MSAWLSRRTALGLAVTLVLAMLVLSSWPGRVSGPTDGPLALAPAGGGPAARSLPMPGAAPAEPAAPRGSVADCAALGVLYAQIYGAAPSPHGVLASLQSPCRAGQDEMSMSLLSNESLSASRVQFAVSLPGPSTVSSRAFQSFWVGMWLAGVPCSYDGAAYLQLGLHPPFSLVGGRSGPNWSVSAPVWDLVPAGSCDPQCQNDTTALTIGGVGYCEDDAVLTGPGALGSAGFGGFAPGDRLTIDLVGSPGGPSGLSVYLNDTVHPGASTSFTYSSAVSVSGEALEPLFDQATASASAWGYGADVAFGATACPGPWPGQGVPSCNSYDGPLVNASSVPELLSASFYNASARAYTGQYASVATASSSGGCSGQASPCADFSDGTGTANYPFFSVHGSAGASWVDLGGSYAAQLSDLGGSATQFAASGNSSGPAALTALGPVHSQVGASGVNLTVAAADPRGLLAVQFGALFCFGSSTPSLSIVSATLGSGPQDTAYDGNWTAHLAASNDTGTFGFFVRAQSDGGGWSDYSFGNRSLSSGSGSCPLATPVAPGFTSANVTALAAGYRLNWTESSAGVFSYLVTAQPNGGGAPVLLDVGAAASAELLGLESSIGYSLSVKATNLVGRSASASPVSASATLGALGATLTGPALTQWVGLANVTYTAGASGGLGPYSYRLSFADGTSAILNSSASTVLVSHDFGGYFGGGEASLTVTDALGVSTTALPTLTPIWATPLAVPQTASAGDGQVTVSWAPPASPAAAVTGFTVFTTTDPASAARLTGAWPANRSGSLSAELWNTTSLSLTLAVPDGARLYAQVVAWNRYGEGLLPSGSPVLVAAPAPFLAGPILGGPGGPAPYNDSFSTAISVGTNDNLTQALYVMPGSVVLAANVSGANGTLWANASYLFPKTGTWLVLLHLTDEFNDVAIVTTTVYVGPGAAPVASIGAGPGPYWVGSPVAFTASVPSFGGPFDVQWSFGDGAVASGSPSSHTYGLAGTYTVLAEIQDNSTGGIASRSLALVVYGLPEVAIVTTAGPAGAGSFEFAAVLGGGNGSARVVWSFGDGTVGTGAVVEHNFTATGRYTVNVSATFAGGRTATSQVDVLVPANASLGAGGTAAAPDWLAIGLGVTAAACLVALVVVWRRSRPPASSWEVVPPAK